jgi:serine/threonine-protein kinase
MEASPGGYVPGMTLGTYRLERLLGHGGMGTVFLAFDTRLHRHVALKVLDKDADTPTSSALLLREARNAAALNHPHICTIYEVGEEGGAAFIAMEYVAGRSVRERIDEGGVTSEDVVRLGIQAASALACAHENGVIHRDLKAANVIVSDSGLLKVVDFGLARRSDARLSDATTMVSVATPGVLAGTPYSMAPEQIRGQTADARTDIWALGVLLYEMATGTKPFTGQTVSELYSSILTQPPDPLPSTVRAELRAVIERCLEKEPARRYQGADAVRAAIETIAGSDASSWGTWRFHLGSRPLFVSAALGLTVVMLVVFNRDAGLNQLAGGSAPGPINLAVLPFENLTGDPDQQYLSDGLADEMTVQLGRINPQRLDVIAQAAVMPYREGNQPITQIAREINADVMLTGTIARSGDRLRLALQLMQASDGRPLWSETYDRSLSDLFILTPEISKSVSSAVGVGAETEAESLTGRPRANSEAIDLYLRGLSRVFRDSEQDIDQAITLLERSAALDPTFVPTQAYLALAYGNKSSIYRPNDPQWEEKGFAAVQKALMMDADAPEAHYAQAIMLWRPSHGFPSREALAELRKAVAARPNFDEAWHQRGFILTHVGHLDAALGDLERAVQLNPANTLARFRLAPIWIYQQKFEDGIAALDRVPRDIFPAQWTYQRAWALISLNRLEEASRLLNGALQESPNDQGGVLHAARAMVRARSGDRVGAETDVAEAIRSGKNFLHFHHTAYTIGAVYTALGDVDKAQEWIENAANTGFPNYAFFETDVHLERLRALPRFRAFVSKLRKEWEDIPGEPQ